MEIAKWLPQVVPYFAAISGSFFSFLAGRQARGFSGLKKLIELRDLTPDNSPERKELDKAIEARAVRVSLSARRRVDGAGMAAVIFVGLLIAAGLALLWPWALSTPSFWTLSLAVVVSFIAVAFIAVGWEQAFTTKPPKVEEKDA